MCNFLLPLWLGSAERNSWGNESKSWRTWERHATTTLFSKRFFASSNIKNQRLTKEYQLKIEFGVVFTNEDWEKSPSDVRDQFGHYQSVLYVLQQRYRNNFNDFGNPNRRKKLVASRTSQKVHSTINSLMLCSPFLGKRKYEHPSRLSDFSADISKTNRISIDILRTKQQLSKMSTTPFM